LFVQIFAVDADAMTDDFKQSGEISNTIATFFAKSKSGVKPATTSMLTIQEVNAFLTKMAAASGDFEHEQLLKMIAKKCVLLFFVFIDFVLSYRCTTDDLCYVVREIKSDLRINAGVAQVMTALAPNAYQAFQV
jgi:hypothetical protein